MERNIGEMERKVRLVLGLAFIAASAFTLFEIVNIYVTLGLALVGVGLTVNYITCFCGIKKLFHNRI